MTAADAPPPPIVETIPAALAGQRLDRVVALVTGASRADAAELVAAGAVLRNGAPCTAKALRLEEGDELQVTWSGPAPPIVLEADPTVPFSVVFEDDDLLVIDKPAGVVVHPGSGHDRSTLVHGLLARYPEIVDVGDPARPGIVHRLDKDTSGLMLVARSPEASAALVAALAARDVHRRYLALVWGHVEVPSGTIDAPIGRSPRDPTRMAVSEQGRPAVTHYRSLRSTTDPVELTHLELQLETGRTHQIRVHLQAIGHPVVGDDRYHGRRASFTVPRLWLHAAGLGLEHPITGEALSFESPLPPDLAGVLDRLS